jgi:hypothetical protein
LIGLTRENEALAVSKYLVLSSAFCFVKRKKLK